MNRQKKKSQIFLLAFSLLFIATGSSSALSETLKTIISQIAKESGLTYSQTRPIFLRSAVNNAKEMAYKKDYIKAYNILDDFLKKYGDEMTVGERNDFHETRNWISELELRDIQRRKAMGD